MSKKEKTLTNEEAARLWEELKQVQRPRPKLTEQHFRQMRHDEKKEELYQVRDAFDDMKNKLSQKSKAPGSLCMLLHTQLQPVYRSTGIETTRTVQHPCLLTEKFQGQERWLWGTSKEGAAKRTLKKLRLDAKRYLATIPKRCSKAVNFGYLKKHINSIHNMENFDDRLQESIRRIPKYDIFLGAYWKLFCTPVVSKNYDNLDRYLGTIPDNVLDGIQRKVNKR